MSEFCEINIKYQRIRHCSFQFFKKQAVKITKNSWDYQT